ncbi:MAG TPA: DUF883 C-terminal domain-containing protein [Kofleriaceae bacterium]
METFENKSKREEMFTAIEDEASGIKQRLGNLGRRIKRIDLRSQIDTHPLTALGIAAGVGALIGLARPMPKRGPISGAMMAIFSTLGFRLLREAAMVQLGQYAKGVLSKDQTGMESNVPQAGQTAY